MGGLAVPFLPTLFYALILVPLYLIVTQDTHNVVKQCNLLKCQSHCQQFLRDTEKRY